MKYISDSLKKTEEIAKKVVDNLKEEQNVILLQGELGAGKTTFAQKVLEYLGAEGPFTSPTFVIMKSYSVKSKSNSEYSGQKSKFRTIYHFDCYRVGARDILDLGWEEIIGNKENLVLVEWPERIKKSWPDNYVKIDFESLGENERKIVVAFSYFAHFVFRNY